jgi:hypothetical protein
MTDSDIHDAIAEPDEKVSPDEVPVCEYTGAMVMPQTEGRPMFVFSTPEGGTVAVRLEDNEAAQQVAREIRTVIP